MQNKIYNIIILLLILFMFVLFLGFSKRESKTNTKENFEISIFTQSSENNSEIIQTETSTVTSVLKKQTSKVSETTVILQTDISEQIVFPLNINTATAEELTFLEGIGNVIAENIVKYREVNGEFQNRNELLDVDGIGESKLSAIWDNIYVENEIFEVYEQESDEYTYYEEYDITEESEITDETFSEQVTEITEPLIVNLNDADIEALMTLPYVTEEIANDIINLRTQIQYFSHPYELLLVESLSQEEVAEIIKFVVV